MTTPRILFIAFAAAVALCIVPQPAAAQSSNPVIAIREIELKPGVDVAEFERFITEQFNPAMQRALPGTRTFIAKGDRGARTGRYTMIATFENAKAREALYPAADKTSALAAGIWERMQLQPLMDRLTTFLVPGWMDAYTDYVPLPATPKTAIADTIFKLPEWTPEQRWLRAAQLTVAWYVTAFAHLRAQGRTPEEIGDVWYQWFGPPRGWNTTNTPWKLVRTAVYNYMSDPRQTVEVLEASDAGVRARLNRPYAAMTSYWKLYNADIDEFERSMDECFRKIAAFNRLTWKQTREGDYLVIDVRNPAVASR